MNMALPVALQLLKFCLFGFALAVQGYSDNNVSPSPLLLSGVPSIKGIPNLAHEPSSATGSPSQPDGSHLPLGPLPFKLSPLPDTIEAHAPAWSPTAFMEFSPSNISPPPVAAEGHLPVSPPSSAVASPPPLYAPPPLFSEENVPSTPSAPKEGDPVNKSPVSEPMIPAPISSPSWNLSQTSPSFHLTQAPSLLPTSPTQVQPDSKPPSTVPITPGPVSSTSRNLPQTLPPFHSTQTPSLSPASPALVEPDGKPPSAVPITAGPVSSPSRNLPQISPLAHPSPGGIPFHNSPQNAPAVPEENPSVMPPTTLATPLENPPQSSPAGVQTSLPPYTNNGNVSNNEPPTLEPINPVAAPLRNSRLSNSQHDNSPVHSNGLHSFSPRANGRNPPGSRPPISVPTAPAPVVSPMGKFPDSSHISPPHTAGAASSPSSAPSPSKQQDRASVLPPANETHQPFPSIIHSPEKSPATAEAPSTHQATRHSHNAAAPHSSSHASHPYKKYHTPAMSPAISSHPGEQNRTSSTAPVAGNLVSHPPPQAQGEIGSPSVPPSRRKRYTAPPPLDPGSSSPYHLPIQTPAKHFAPSPSPSVVTSRQTNTHLISPKVSPPESSSTIPQVPLLPSIQWFPPPPPNEGCTATTCTEPYTNTLPGSPCGCIWPMQVGLRLSVALYTFFPLVSELAAEVASGVFMKRSQVRIMGANAASDQLDKTIVLIDLVPIGNKFDMPTAFSTYQRFWHKQVSINGSLFGDYDVLYVHYPGLPPSPPLPPSIGIIDNGPYSSENNPIKPLGVDVQKRLHKHGLSRGMIAIVVLSAAVALALFSAIALIFLLRYRDGASQPASTPRGSLQALAKPSGSPGSMHASGLSSASLSFGSSVIAYNGSAKTFGAAEIERATNSFDASGVLGEGGFGRVYCGILENGTKVAIKVLKRDDQQGSREFLAEVEMLTRLHHRNLVKLIGICTEDRLRCLVYELIPNGSVESHLHGVDKESAPLDWDARVKIALGAARGLAYLHEDSSPHVIHRDFKASNILLEHDFTPKVSDFGLARTAMDEEGHHISTRVVGTFGYVAPEYAMTGHLLVKSDVYSYGVVLLELLTGRKPVDMSQPPGQENLVAWASPLLTNREGLEAIIDPSLGPEVPFDTVAKVAAIASMCVQLEVSHRPFMGEVVQALKLVSNECDEAKEFGSRSSGADDSSIDLDARASGRLDDPLQSLYPVPHYGSDVDEERGVSVSARFDRDLSGSFRRHSSSGPVRTEQSRRLWQKITRSMRGSVSEHGFMFRFWPSSR